MQEIDNCEMLIKDILQYFHYFIRPDFRQKPDIELATERYREIADKRTVEELKDIVGKGHHVDFDSLGSDRIELERNSIEYDPTVDGPLTEYEDEDEEIIMGDDEDEVDDDENEDK